MLSSEYTLYSDFLLSNLYWVVGLSVLALIALIFGIDYYRSKRKDLRRNSQPEKDKYLTALGGAGNVLSHELVGSRIVLTLKDYSQINKSLLTEAGVTGFIEKSDKLTLVIKDGADVVYNVLFPR